MKRIGVIGLTGVALVMLLAASWAPVFAWEIDLKGETEWRYRYWTRTGNNDIFGQMDANAVYLGINHLQTFPTWATTNRASGTFGVLAGENRFGADMCLNDYRMTIFPKIVVNKAISVEASVNLTSLGIWSDGQPLDSRTQVTRASGGAADTTFNMQNPGFVNSLYVPIQDRAVAVDVPNTYVTLQWLKMSIRTPMLDFSIGYKDSKIGMGLWKHTCNRASSSFGMTAYYGPFKFGLSPYFARSQSAWALNTTGTTNNVTGANTNTWSSSPATPTSRNQGVGASQRQEDRRDYFRAIEGEIEYSAGCWNFQLVSDSYREPSAPTPTPRGVALPAALPRPSEDIVRYRIALATKYFNGRFFFNGEADWFNRWRSGRGTADPGTNAGVTVRQDRDNNGWLYGTEMGVVAGPSKVTLNYVRATGNDPSTRHTTEDAADSEQSLSACYMKNWGYLMYYMYGAGDGWDAAGYGQPTNLQHVGAKLDYAVASNLNISALYAYAWRDQPTAYRLGGNYQLGLRQWTNDDILAAHAGVVIGRAVPDSAREIGWEVDLGINWKILEGLTWNTTFSYWKPGNWWAYAFPNTAAIYRAGVAPNANTSEALAIRDLGRDIDALFAVETTLQINF
jgi:hypothetical protein